MASHRCLIRWAAILCIVCITAALAAQTQRPSFAVASVKKRDSRKPFPPASTPAQTPVFYAPNATVRWLLGFAYDVSDMQIVGGPDWIGRDIFEINARSAEDSSEADKRLMVQSLLEERFKLVAHKEQHSMEFGALVLARNAGDLGPELRPCSDADASEPPIRWPRGGILSIVRCEPIAAVARIAEKVVRMPMVDKTGLTGRWNVVLTYADPQPRSPGVAGAEEPNLPSFSAALQEQAGLRVERTVGLIDVLVIDSVRQPTEN